MNARYSEFTTVSSSVPLRELQQHFRTLKRCWSNSIKNLDRDSSTGYQRTGFSGQRPGLVHLTRLFPLFSPLRSPAHPQDEWRNQSHLLHASDGLLYVTKFQKNPQHARILASEFSARKIGMWLGLPTPQVEVIDVSEWLIKHSLELRIETDHRLLRCSNGRQLAFSYVADEQNAGSSGFCSLTND